MLQRDWHDQVVCLCHRGTGVIKYCVCVTSSIVFMLHRQYCVYVTGGLSNNVKRGEFGASK